MPFTRRLYRFDYARATDAEALEVLRLCGHGRSSDPEVPAPSVGETRISFEMGGSSGTSREILRYRKLFVYVAEESSLTADVKDACGLLPVSLPPDTYFEDENERPISLVQVFDEEAQRTRGEGATAILMDHPESVLRHAPAEPVRAELWTRSDADLMAQLADVHTHLMNSRWLHSRCVVTPVAKDKCHATFPVHEDCVAVILPFRQLCSRDKADDLFNRCCKLHNRHCSPRHPAHAWVAFYQNQFNTFLERPVAFPLCRTSLCARRYLDAFAYGARVVHATSRNSDSAADLSRLLAEHAREQVVMGYHYVLRTLLGYVSLALPVLARNVAHWVNELGWANGSAPRGRVLLGG